LIDSEDSLRRVWERRICESVLNECCGSNLGAAQCPSLGSGKEKERNTVNK